jgi:hypothetical protein
LCCSDKEARVSVSLCRDKGLWTLHSPIFDIVRQACSRPRCLSSRSRIGLSRSSNLNPRLQRAMHDGKWSWSCGGRIMLMLNRTNKDLDPVPRHARTGYQMHSRKQPDISKRHGTVLTTSKCCNMAIRILHHRNRYILQTSPLPLHLPNTSQQASHGANPLA